MKVLEIHKFGRSFSELIFAIGVTQELSWNLNSEPLGGLLGL